MKNLLEKYVRRGRCTASRIWDKTAFVFVLPFDNSNFKKRTLELGPTGTYIWRLLENKPKLKEVANCLAKKKRISRTIVEKEVVKFVKKLAKKKIVDIIDEAADE